ncbi:hypothetical protein CI610_01683 [invertebrate metagenome]|uniref:MalT-like TPR region domain-containing protein n=1 Tax=invertebrate metagenome TaxID=1711999 RepID=A0A2H9T7W6_9ZZZZ
MKTQIRHYRLISVALLLLLLSGCSHLALNSPPSKLSQKREHKFVQQIINKEKQFKQKGLWKKHIQEGEKALAIAQEQKDERSVMILSIQLASSWFYLGNSDACLKSAQKAHSLAIKQSDYQAQIQSLYLISAAQRSQNNPQTVQTAHQALALCDRFLPDDFGLKAKVLYNLAAAESDIAPLNLSSSEKHLKEAALCYRTAGMNYEQVRITRRMAEIQYRRGHYQQAEHTLLSTTQKKNPREELIYEYQLAKVQHRLKQWEKAYNTALKALEKANKLEAQTEIPRLKTLINAIEHQKFIRH